MTKANVLIRAWLYDNEPSQIEVWEHEFEPTEGGSRSGSEWAREHLCSCCDDDDLRQLFELPKEGNFQVLVKGTINGCRSGGFEFDEWDEDFEVEEVKFQAVSEEYMKFMFQAEKEAENVRTQDKTTD